jgi:hypothetical protein
VNPTRRYTPKPAKCWSAEESVDHDLVVEPQNSR